LDIWYTLSDAIKSQSSVRVTLFGPYEDETLEGGSGVNGDTLYIVVDGERERVPLDRLIRVD
jgi:hypothetical protein